MMKILTAITVVLLCARTAFGDEPDYQIGCEVEVNAPSITPSFVPELRSLAAKVSCKSSGPFLIKASSEFPKLRIGLTEVSTGRWEVQLELLSTGNDSVELSFWRMAESKTTDKMTLRVNNIATELETRVRGALGSPDTVRKLLQRLLRDERRKGSIDVACRTEDRCVALLPWTLGRWLRESQFRIVGPDVVYYAAGTGHCDKRRTPIEQPSIEVVFIRPAVRRDLATFVATVAFDTYEPPVRTCETLQPAEARLTRGMP